MKMIRGMLRLKKRLRELDQIIALCKVGSIREIGEFYIKRVVIECFVDVVRSDFGLPVKYFIDGSNIPYDEWDCYLRGILAGVVKK